MGGIIIMACKFWIAVQCKLCFCIILKRGWIDTTVVFFLFTLHVIIYLDNRSTVSLSRWMGIRRNYCFVGKEWQDVLTFLKNYRRLTQNKNQKSNRRNLFLTFPLLAEFLQSENYWQFYLFLTGIQEFRWRTHSAAFLHYSYIDLLFIIIDAGAIFCYLSH